MSASVSVSVRQRWFWVFAFCFVFFKGVGCCGFGFVRDQTAGIEFCILGLWGCHCFTDHCSGLFAGSASASRVSERDD